MSKPVATVVILAYNHGAFIEQAVASVLSQQVDFPVEVIVSDDTSPDDTWQRLQAFKSHPWVRLVQRPRSEVIYIRGRPTGRSNFHKSLLEAQGDFVCHLDGDDYWTDPTKLQRQVDALRTDVKASLCFHTVKVSDETHGRTWQANTWRPDRPYTFNDHALTNQIRQVSVCWRRSMMELPFPHLLLYEADVGDYFVNAFSLSRGHGVYLQREMACYRKHAGGVYSALDSAAYVDFGIRLKKQMLQLFPEEEAIISQGLALEHVSECFHYLRQGAPAEAHIAAHKMRWRHLPQAPRPAVRFLAAKVLHRFPHTAQRLLTLSTRLKRGR